MYYIIINLKAYEKSFNKNAIKLLNQIKEVSKKKFEIIVCPNFLDIKDFTSQKKIKVFSQDVSEFEMGAHTGKIPIEFLKNLGACGSIINHSENRLKFSQIENIVKRAKSLKFKICICVRNLQEAKKVDKLSPDFIAFEPKSLIGGNISVTSSKPKIISEIVKNVKNSKVLVGAGVKTSFDVKKSIELGAYGILISSKIANSNNPKKELLEILK